MKYGPIICDPDSKEARALIGKKVVGGWDFSTLKNNPEYYTPTRLSRIGILCSPFVTDCDSFFFIREVIEEKPKYRPYESCDEMVEDFKKRFCSHTTIPQFAMPLIWVMPKKCLKPKMLITSYDDELVTLEGVYNKSFEELFNYYTYLDGSPIGKKE